MATFPARNLNQKCVYWGSPVNDGYGGYTWATPVELSCRWQKVSNVVAGADGREIVSQITVVLAQDVDEEGMLIQCELSDLTVAERADPVVAGAYQIKRFDKIPTLDGRRFFRAAYL